MPRILKNGELTIANPIMQFLRVFYRRNEIVLAKRNQRWHLDFMLSRAHVELGYIKSKRKNVGLIMMKCFKLSTLWLLTDGLAAGVFLNL